MFSKTKSASINKKKYIVVLSPAVYAKADDGKEIRRGCSA